MAWVILVVAGLFEVSWAIGLKYTEGFTRPVRRPHVRDAGLQRSVKWGMSYHGIRDGWCYCCGGFADHVKLMLVNGAALVPVPPVKPLAMGKSTRGVELKSVEDLDQRQIAAWMKQVAAVPGVGGKKSQGREVVPSARARRPPGRGTAGLEFPFKERAWTT